ncbi:hypothetical protein [Methylocapsa palsarum]|uniref:hypothetical protein n=1 Tax=Methylocapsa palsarum TaxID=1612308 RepID=UPI001113AEFA|nr:hypothetical protein [Methylocapsa palsarum]
MTTCGRGSGAASTPPLASTLSLASAGICFCVVRVSSPAHDKLTPLKILKSDQGFGDGRLGFLLSYSKIFDFDLYDIRDKAALLVARSDDAPSSDSISISI